MDKALSPSEAPTPEDRPNIKQLLEVMRIKDIDITTRWHDLGIELVDSYKVLRVIEADHPHNVEACCRVMFEKWLERTPDASWSQLVTALNNIEMITAADAISKRLMLEKKPVKCNIHTQKSTENSQEFVVDPVCDENHAEVSIKGSTNITSVSFSNYNIPAAFSHLTAEVSKLLKRADFYTLRRGIVQQRRVPRGVQFPDDLHQSIKAAQNLDALLDVLADSEYWSWVDLRLLEALVTSSGIQEAEILIQKYKEAIFPRKLSDILDKLPLPQQKDHKIAYTTKVGTKIQKEPNEVTVGDLSHYCNILEAVIMDINSGSCVLEHLDNGCLEIQWLIPVHYAFHAYKSALNNRHKFRDIHLGYLQIKPYPPIYNPFTIQPTILSTLLHLPKPIASTPAEVIDHYYCFLADNLDNNVICQTLLKLKVISEKDVMDSTKMCSEYQQNAFLLDHLLVTSSTIIVEFCHMLQNTTNQQQFGDMLLNALPSNEIKAVTDRQSSSTPFHLSSSEKDGMDISPVYQPEVFLAAKTVRLRFLHLIARLRQNLKDHDPKCFLAAYNNLMKSASHFKAIPLLASGCSEDLDNAGTEELFSRLSFMWTWNDHSVLRALLEACDYQEGITMLDDFESQIDTSQPMELFPIPPPSIKMAPSLSSLFTVLSIRSERYEDELAPLQYVNDVTTIMIEKFSISSHALQLLATRANPLMLYLMILKSITPIISKGVNEHLDVLKEKGFSEIAIYPNTILYANDNLSHGSFALLSSQPQDCSQCKYLRNELRRKTNALKKQGDNVTDQTQEQVAITETTDEQNEDTLEGVLLAEPSKDESDREATLKLKLSITESEELMKENEGMKIEISKMKIVINQLHEDLNAKNSDLTIPNLKKENNRLRELVNKYQKSNLPVELKPLPKSADNMLLLKDLPEKFKENNLELYIDEITHLKYEEEEYTYDIKLHEGNTVVLVTFNDVADLDDIIGKISKKPFTKAVHHIKAEKVPVCTSVIIKNLPPDKCDEETLDLYFSNKRKSGVDHYESIEILANNTAVVDFGDEQSLKVVLTKDHKWLGEEVIMYQHNFLLLLEKRIALKRPQWKYLSQFTRTDWTKLVAKAVSKNVSLQQPISDDKNPIIVLEGDPDATRQISAELQTLIAAIYTNNPPLVVSRPGTVKYFVNEDGQKMISEIETSEKSFIQLSIETQNNSVEASRATTRNNEKCKATTKEGKVITLVMGDITECTVDVIVNAANRQLDHGDGVAGTIVRKGGRIIQEESNHYVQNEGSLFDGDAVMMKEVGNLPCQRLVHAVGPKWNGGDKNEEEFLKNACTESLKLATNYQSIAFPAISAGIYGFPAETCAHCMIEAFTSWSMENGLSTLHDIHVVVNDIIIANAFTEEMQKHGQLKVLPQFLKFADTGIGSPDNRDAAAGSQSVVPTQPMITDLQIPELPFSDISIAKQYIYLQYRDLLKCSAEIYVNTASNDLNLNNGAQAKSLLKAGGQSLQDECTSYVTRNGKLSPGDIVVTGPGKLPCDKVIHTVGMAYNGRESEKVLENIIKKCLEEADRCGATSIAFPALGAGNLGYPSHVVARIMVGTVATYFKSHRYANSIETVLLMINIQDVFKKFQKMLLIIPDDTVLHIQIFAGSEDAVQQTEGRLQRVIQNRFKVNSIDNDDRVSKLTREQILEFEETAKQHQVELQFEPNFKRIHFKGDWMDVHELKRQILNALHIIGMQEINEKAAKRLQDKVKYKAKWQGAPEKPALLPSCIQTENIITAEFPSSWEVMPKDSSGKEIVCHVVDLQPSDPEYKEVHTAFTSTMPPAGLAGGDVWKGVVKIQRIQNPALYAQYAGRKKVMEKENPAGIQNERRLFHGCKGDVVKNIHHQGFNRSFAGANATVLGEGAYFAVNASYSARETYSPPDANGNRFMFYARVLTGEYTQGQHRLKVPPPKDPSKSKVILYDSVVDIMKAPNIYVVFSDAQCYPDYLITFT